MYMSGFGKNSGPSGPPRPHTPFGSSPSPPFPSPTPSSNPNPNPNPNPVDERSPSSIAAASTPQLPWLPQTPPQRGMIAISPQRWDNQPKQPSSHAYSTNNQQISPSISSAITHDSEPMYAKRTRSPPLPSPENSLLGDLSSNQANSGSRLGMHPEKHSENGSDGPVKRMKSPLLVFESSRSAQNHGVAHGHAQRPDISPPRSGNQRITPFQDVDNPPRQRLFGLQSHAPSHDSGAISPPKAQYFDAPKRARSPPLRTSDGSMGTMSVQLDSEREMQAKAKRLSRFSVELSQPILDQHDPMRYKFTGIRHNQDLVSKVNTINHTDVTHSLGMGDSLSDYEGLGSNAVVVGLCPDMCPESEREERERKGDLDKYERLDGDRNQTSKFLAIKKYNRTAERDAELIRPMPILLKTIGYLLNLLDQPYGDDFLGIYNFLWDRMRAIRMDLRMQHMFNEEAITMLEQMVRLHIIAMHELCEYQKGEGFSEGFDAHLNIEQMNKTSVELFQMYDDHRNKGKSVPTEKEFRGYYALLKLDRHPGYKVEPAELSLDLAKMTPEIRCTPEIMFARDVARACRTGNYISFFRLARKATYLQACLMHAHFAKLRTQALASLHSGLQNNQGIPVEHVVNWLAMEGEDIESLLEYHGFMIKKYEEMYMVKEGPFLNSDIEFPTKCSQLVCLKKSKTIIDDVYSGHSFSSVCEERETAQDIVEMVNQDSVVSGTESWVNMIDEEMLDDKVETDPTTTIKSQPLLGEPSPANLNSKSEGDLQKVSLVGASSPSLDDIIFNPAHSGEKVVELDEVVPTDETPLLKLSGSIFQAGTPGKANSNHIENLEPRRALGKSVQNELLMIVHHENDEVTREKHKQILRKWKQQSSKLREIREHRMFLANAALSSLSLGPPIQRSEDQLRCPTSMLNIEFIARKRHGKQGKSWARLNVSELVASILSARNPDSKCISWKLVVCANLTETDSKEYHLASKWLQSKLLGSVKENDGKLLVPSSGISIWKKWIDTKSSPLQSCCLSIIRVLDISQPFTEDTVAGLSCLLFVVSGSIPWEIQRVQLHNFLKAIPSGSSLPLLIVNSDLHKEESTNPSSTIIDGLDLLGVEKTKIKSYKVVFLTGDGQQEASNVFFDDDQLREGLMWLANNSRPQPSLHLMKTRELVLHNLRQSLDVLDNLHICDVGPHHCISAFNEALDRSVEEVLAAASANPSHWPCPEINLLENSSSEQMVACMFLPSIGWSSATKVELVARALEGCKLPSFSDDISWLNQGCRVGEEIQNQKLALQECIIRYMTQYSQLDMDLAVREANIMLQKGAALDLRGSCYHIVPRWVMIFRRIFNWQLMRLTSGECSFAYILEQKDEPCAGDSFSSSNVIRPLNSVVGVKDLEDYSGSVQQPSGHSLVPEISLDEMVEISCSIPFLQQPLQAHSPVCTPPSLVHESIHVRSKISGDVHDPQINSSGDHLLETNNLSDEANDKDLRCKADVGDAFEHGRRNEERMSPLSKKDDRLSKLLDQCKRLQDMIDEKLAIYF